MEDEIDRKRVGQNNRERLRERDNERGKKEKNEARLWYMYDYITGRRCEGLR